MKNQFFKLGKDKFLIKMRELICSVQFVRSPVGILSFLLTDELTKLMVLYHHNFPCVAPKLTKKKYPSFLRVF